MTLFALVLSDV